MSQRALADAAGMRQPAIARLEAGDVMPTLPTLERGAHALGRDLSVEMVARNTGEGRSSPAPPAVPFAPA
jgi:predicted transcriptional regulator